jgi:ASC-1-like (ASCH) protein
MNTQIKSLKFYLLFFTASLIVKQMTRHLNVNVQEPWFTLISLGLKKVEGRLNKGKFAKMEKGDEIEFVNGDRSVIATITSIVEYPSFYRYLRTEGLSRCLPGVKTLREGVNVYYKYFTKEQEKEHGILAVRIKV